ncbi:hypothetical protein ACFVXC_05595 [Streptomyces sp. NPDC058257]|uniref:hypothetical protein n=1 Tax=Streptomyces sp. NPDC058257 TaxID=3346409 RepID=UPI0036EB906D
MNLTINIGPRFQRAVHHALKLLALLTPGAVALNQLTSKHWAYLAGAWTANVILLLLLVLHIATHTSTEWCPRHKPFDPTALRHRLAVRLAGLTWLAIAAIVVYTIVGSYFSDPDHKATAITLRTTISLLALYWGGLAVIAVNLFAARNKDALPEPKPSRHSTTLTEYGRRLAHRSHWLVLIAASAATALVFAPDAGVWNSARTISTFLVVAAIIGDIRHSSSLCETCVSEFRVDAPQYADKRRWLFTIDHRGRRTYLVLAVLSLIAGHLFERHTAPSIANSIGIMVVFAGITLVNRFHRTYQPWCPYCRNGGGGHEHTEVPNPTGGHGRPVPV